jgi:hypothetical protein
MRRFITLPLVPVAQPGYQAARSPRRRLHGRLFWLRWQAWPPEQPDGRAAPSPKPRGICPGESTIHPRGFRRDSAWGRRWQRSKAGLSRRRTPRERRGARASGACPGTVGAQVSIHGGRFAASGNGIGNRRGPVSMRRPASSLQYVRVRARLLCAKFPGAELERAEALTASSDPWERPEHARPRWGTWRDHSRNDLGATAAQASLRSFPKQPFAPSLGKPS